jgi:hypothetical protein
MRAFAFGLIVGAAVCFAVLRIIDSPPAQDAENEQLAAHPVPPPIPASSIAPSCPEVTKVSAAPTPSRPSAERNNEPKAPIDQARIALDATSDQEANQLCSHALGRKERRERARKEAEPKDAGWAYSTEELVRYHIESQMSPDQYKKLQIDCRTTFCEVTMEGVGEESRVLANKVAQEIAKQPWSEMVYRGSGGSSIGDDWTFKHEWFRPTTESERRLYPLQRN